MVDSGIGDGGSIVDFNDGAIQCIVFCCFQHVANFAARTTTATGIHYRLPDYRTCSVEVDIACIHYMCASDSYELFSICGPGEATERAETRQVVVVKEL